jgi:DHA2 family multidrug resistance protein
VVVAPAIGPTLGGWITDNLSWRWVFLLNVPVGLMLSLLAGRVLTDPPELVALHNRRLSAGLNLDYVGLALLVLGMGALQIMLDKGQEDDWFASAIITRLFIVSTVSLVAFVIWELGRAEPIVDLRLLVDRNFAVGNVLMFVLGFVLLASTALLPLFVQSLMGYTATDAGLVISPGGFALILVIPVVGALSGKIDARWLIAAGFVGCALALYSMTRFDAEIDYATIAWARVYQSVPLALLFIPINTVALAAMPTAKSNNASAIINMVRNIGGSVGISLATTLIARRAQYHQSMLVEHATSLSSPYNTAVHALQQTYLAYSGSAVDALHQAQAQIYAMVQRQAAFLSFNDAFWVMAIVLAAMVPLVLLMRKPPPGAAPPHTH